MPTPSASIGVPTTPSFDFLFGKFDLLGLDDSVFLDNDESETGSNVPETRERACWR